MRNSGTVKSEESLPAPTVAPWRASSAGLSARQQRQHPLLTHSGSLLPTTANARPASSRVARSQ